jgi:hypothetical protein
MSELLGTSLSAFIGFTVVVLGFCAFMTGQALAESWRPSWQIYPYSLLLGAADRFLQYALFGGELLSPSGYVVGVVVMAAICEFAYRAARARAMVRQYPWLYERVGLFGWRERR